MSKISNILLSPLKYKWFAFTKLPSLVFWGVKVSTLDDAKCVVKTKYGWTNQNPFKSMYFSALCGSAELSTGGLVMHHIEGKGNWSMLVTDFKANFSKKAVGVISFVCEDGLIVQDEIKTIMSSQTGTGTFDLHSTAINDKGETVASFVVSWSLKQKR